ncbi:VOC family protein [Actinokineospora enzanensis]|uniref:VOC family protein n=1 Tax=Actinokineospora enzanensis TaxID=155975 RepID=UPI00037946ED|nr:VOC family protein [Actinokineospora enzanensis]
MSARLNPYLNFPGTARQAMEFYQEVFGGHLVLNTFGELGGADGTPLADKIMHGQLETPSGFTLMGADLTPDMPHDRGVNSMVVSLSGDDDALRGYWEKLSADGTVTTPLEKQMWGDEYGACVDRFGIPWLVNIGAPR